MREEKRRRGRTTERKTGEKEKKLKVFFFFLFDAHSGRILRHHHLAIPPLTSRRKEKNTRIHAYIHTYIHRAVEEKRKMGRIYILFQLCLDVHYEARHTSNECLSNDSGSSACLYHVGYTSQQYLDRIVLSRIENRE